MQRTRLRRVRADVGIGPYEIIFRLPNILTFFQ